MKNQKFALADSVTSTETEKEPYDGIFGLAMEDLEPGYTTLLENMKNQRLINKKLFALYLSGDGHNSNAGRVFIGDYDNSCCTDADAFHVVPLSDPNYYWQITTSYITLDGEDLTTGDTEAIVDSGSPYISEF